MKYSTPPKNPGKKDLGKSGYYQTPDIAGYQVKKWNVTGDDNMPDVSATRNKAQNKVIKKSQLLQVPPDNLSNKYQIRSFKKGGLVPKTGIYKLHKGEKVIKAKLNTAAEKHMFGRKYST